MSVIFEKTHGLKNQSFSASILEKKDRPANMAWFDPGSSIAKRHKVEASV